MLNKVTTIEEAMSHVHDGDRIMVGGFGLRGAPDMLIDALVATGKKNLTIISNDLGSPNIGLGRLLEHGMIKGLIGNFYNWNKDAIQAYNEGRITVKLLPQGSFAESIRAAGVGIPAYFTLASAGTDLGVGKETREYNGKQYVLEEAVSADVALVRAYKADTLGNLVYCKVARNFNPLMAMAAKYTIVEADEIVPVGSLDPESVITQHIYVDAIIPREA